MEFLGLISFVPIFQFLNANGDVAKLISEHSHWQTLKALFDGVGAPLNLASLLILTSILLLMRQALTVARALFESNSREAASARLRALIFARFLSADLDYQDRIKQGGLVEDLTFNAIRAVQHIYGRFVLATQSAIAVVYILGAFLLDWRMTLLLLLVIGISVAVVVPQLLKTRKLGKQLVNANKRVTEFIVERLSMARLVRLSGMETAECRSIWTLSDNQRVASYGVWRALAIMDSTLEVIATFIGLTIIYLSVTVLGARVEMIGIFLTMLLRLMPVVRQLAQSKQANDSNRASFDAVVKRIDELEAARETSKGKAAFPMSPKLLEVRNISYRYPTRSEQAALSDVSLTIVFGTLTAIVGPSGSGKSKLVDLLPRLRRPQRGEVSIDGVDIAEFSLAGLRKSIAFVSQTPLIFDVPLADHIRYGAEAAAMDDVIKVAKLSGSHEFIARLPQGYETKAGDGGKLLSGGQRQRLDLARVLLSNAPILILDEPTTGLDAESVRQLTAALKRIRAETDKTIIIISHDLGAFTDADQIVVMNAGRVEDAGTHAELTARGGWYFRAQSNVAVSPAPLDEAV